MNLLRTPIRRKAKAMNEAMQWNYAPDLDPLWLGVSVADPVAGSGRISVVGFDDEVELWEAPRSSEPSSPVAAAGLTVAVSSYGAASRFAGPDLHDDLLPARHRRR